MGVLTISDRINEKVEYDVEGMKLKAKKKIEDKWKEMEKEVEESDFAREELNKEEKRYRYEVMGLKSNLMGQLYETKKDALLLIYERKAVDAEKSKIMKQITESVGDCEIYWRKLNKHLEENAEMDKNMKQAFETLRDSDFDEAYEQEEQAANETSNVAVKHQVRQNDSKEEPRPNSVKLNAQSTFVPIGTSKPSASDLDFNRLANMSLAKIGQDFKPEIEAILTERNYKEILRDKYNGMSYETYVPPDFSMSKQFKEDEVISHVDQIIKLYKNEQRISS